MITLSSLTTLLSFHCIAITNIGANKIKQLIHNNLFWKMKFPSMLINYSFSIKFNLIIVMEGILLTHTNAQKIQMNKQKRKTYCPNELFVSKRSDQSRNFRRPLAKLIDIFCIF